MLSPARVWQVVVERDFMSGDVVGLAAASGIVNACLDIAGKAYGVPVYRLLGGAVRDRIPVYANGWYQGERTPETFARLAREATDRGHRALKVDPYGAAGLLATDADVEEAARLVGAVRDAVGPDVTLNIDGHGRFSPAIARRAIAALAEHRIGFFEEPVAPTNLEALQELRKLSPIPIAAGERCIGRNGFRGLVERDCVDVIQPDCAWVGGLLEVQRIASWAELHSMLVALHNANSTLATMTALHAAATLPNLLVVETFNDFDEQWVWDALPGLPPVLEGCLALPEAPGIGVLPNEDALADHPPKPTFMDMNVPGWEFRHAVIH